MARNVLDHLVEEQVWSKAHRSINTLSVCGDDNHKPQQLKQNLAKTVY